MRKSVIEFRVAEIGVEYSRRLLGHSHISTMQRYMHLDDSELADVQDLVDLRTGGCPECILFNRKNWD